MYFIHAEHKWPGYEAFTIDDLNERDSEYITVLESNINHPLVKELHLFYTDEEALTVCPLHLSVCAMNCMEMGSSFVYV